LNENALVHKKEPVIIAEENYFFKLSKYSDQILDLLKTDKLKIVPSFRKNEIMKMLE
jgi:methionyl-tRNA synthetase